MSRFFVALSLLVIVLSGHGVAQQSKPGPPTEPAERPTTAAGVPLAHSVRVENAPVIDGDVLNDPAYADVPPVSGFLQNTPDAGRPASERTEVRIVHTNDILFFGIICYVRDPATLIVSDSRRDSLLDETDSFQIILDTYLDKQNGFVFGTNPAGIEYDGQVTNEGQGSGRFSGGGGGRRPGGSRQQRGSGGGFNLNWDGVWQVSTQVSDDGWTAEIAIPFRTLRYPPGEQQTWGMNFQRNIRYRNESSYWASLPRQFNLNRLSLAGELQGLDVPTQRNVKLTPYVLGEAIRRTETHRTTQVGEVGADFKFSITPSLTLDATYNTDFAQVEVDDQQINLDRFNLFFPEKRPFFLENAGLFSVGSPGQVEIFFSRRIGLGEDGEQIPIIGGGRLSGKVGNTNIGLLNMQTGALDAIGAPSQNFSVARVRQDFTNRSNIGAIVVNRKATGDLAADRDSNQTFAVDGRLGIGQKGTISGFLAQTDTPDGERQDTHAYGVAAQRDSERARLRIGYTEVAPNFQPQVGFLARESYRQMSGSVFTFFRPDNSFGIHELRPHINHTTTFDFTSGIHESQLTHIDNHIEWTNGYEIHTGVNITREGVFEAFPLSGVEVQPGRYDHKEAQIVFNTNQGAPVSVEVRTIAGGLFGGDRFELRPSISVRTGETLSAQLEWSYNDLELPGGDFATNLGRVRVSYSFSTRMFLQALVQYNDLDDLWSSNVRFGLLSDANTGLFIVYNDIQGLGRQIPNGAGRTLTVKYSHLFDIFH